LARAALADRSSNPPGRFGSAALRAALRRRAVESGALLLALAGVALALALGSYDPADPSLSTATSRLPANLVGPAGAVAADLLLQGFGWAGVLPAVLLLAWAGRLAVRHALPRAPLRAIAAILAVPLLAGVAALLPLPEALPAPAGAGGGAGPAVLAVAAAALAGPLGAFGAVVGQAVLVALAMALTLFALALPMPLWRAAGRASAGVVRGAGRAGLGLWRAATARRADPPPPPRPSPGRERLAAASAPRGPGFRLPRLSWPAWLSRRRAPERPSLATILRNAEAAATAAPDPPVVGRPSEPPPVKPRIAERAKPAKPKPPAQPALDLAPPPGHGFQLPPPELLTEPPARRSGGPTEESLAANARLLEGVLEDYGVRGRIVEIRPGPVVTLYELEPAPGTKAARVIGLADDIARSMSVVAVRIARVPARNIIGIELPNPKRETVFFREMLDHPDWAKQHGRLPLALGKDIGGAPVYADLARMPHLLIAGTTGSGKSVGINTMILSLLHRFTPEEVRFIMIDPKMLELSVYDRIPHLLAPVVTEPPKAIGALKWTVREMERRYRAMSQLGVRNIAGYNEKVAEAAKRGEVLTRRVQTGFDPETGKPVFEEQPLALTPLPMIVVVIDEMADLMIVAGKEIEAAVQRLAQMARAAGIHVIMATQRPSVDVITGTIKANFPTRISFAVTSKIDSRTILGEQGAEQLLGQGDMLFMGQGGRIERVHGPFVSDSEVERVVEWLRGQGEPAYLDEVTEEDEDAEAGKASGLLGGNTDSEASLYDRAVELVTREGKASTSFVQRHLNIGYNRAAKLIEQMEKNGVVGPANHVGKREVLAPGPRE
jgi:S-DNA-T family DNA segregation ATPase FtsK/SpoIIIE